MTGLFVFGDESPLLVSFLKNETIEVFSGVAPCEFMRLLLLLDLLPLLCSLETLGEDSEAWPFPGLPFTMDCDCGVVVEAEVEGDEWAPLDGDGVTAEVMVEEGKAPGVIFFVNDVMDRFFGVLASWFMSLTGVVGREGECVFPGVFFLVNTVMG